MSDAWGDGISVGQTHPTVSSPRALWQAELRSLAALALPVVIQTSAQQGMTVTDQVFLGHLGTSELGAAALANSYTNLMWFFLLGFATALDTLGSHAYGAGDRRALVKWCTAAAIILSLLLAPLVAAMALGETAGRVLFGQDEHTARLIGHFCDGLILGMWPLMWGTVLTKYLQVQNIMLLPSLIAIITFVLNIAFNALLVHTIGFRGAPLATSFSRWVQFLMLAAAVWHHERRHQQRKRRPSNEEPEPYNAVPVAGAALALQPLTELAQPVAIDATDRSNRGAAADRSNCGVSTDGLNGGTAADRSYCGNPADGSNRGVLLSRSSRGTVVDKDWGTLMNGKSIEELFLLGKDRASDEEESTVASGVRDVDGADGATRRSDSGGVLRGGNADSCDRGFSSFAAEDSAAAGCTEQPQRLLPEGIWRTLYLECRMAMHPNVLIRFCRLGIPGGLSLAFEAGCFDFSTVLAGRLGTAATAAHTAMLSIVTLTYLACPFALATAGAIRVGNLLGAGEPEGARRAGALAVAISGIFMAMIAIIILATRSILGYMFSSDSRVVAIIRNLALFAALFQVSDGLMGSSQGVLRGCGHQHMTAVFNFTGFWICGVLLGYLLCFKAGLGLDGLWAGISTGDTATGIMNLVAMSRLHWRKEADKAVARLKALAQQAEEEHAMLGSTGSAGLDVGGDAGLAGTSSVTVLDGGGRSYAGGLKRIWSERKLRQAVKEARWHHDPGNIEPQNSVTSRFMRSLSSMFRRHQQPLMELDIAGGARAMPEMGHGVIAYADEYVNG